MSHSLSYLIVPLGMFLLLLAPIACPARQCSVYYLDDRDTLQSRFLTRLTGGDNGSLIGSSTSENRTVVSKPLAIVFHSNIDTLPAGRPFVFTLAQFHPGGIQGKTHIEPTYSDETSCYVLRLSQQGKVEQLGPARSFSIRNEHTIELLFDPPIPKLTIDVDSLIAVVATQQRRCEIGQWWCSLSGDKYVTELEVTPTDVKVTWGPCSIRESTTKNH